MGITYFDGNNAVSEKSPKNMPRPFRSTEAYYLRDGQTEAVPNPDFNLEVFLSVKDDAVRAERKDRYQKETDPILLEIQSMKILEQDTSAKEKEFSERYNQIKLELPLN